MLCHTGRFLWRKASCQKWENKRANCSFDVHFCSVFLLSLCSNTNWRKKLGPNSVCNCLICPKAPKSHQASTWCDFWNSTTRAKMLCAETFWSFRSVPWFSLVTPESYCSSGGKRKTINDALKTEIAHGPQALRRSMCHTSPCTCKFNWKTIYQCFCQIELQLEQCMKLFLV